MTGDHERRRKLVERERRTTGWVRLVGWQAKSGQAPFYIGICRVAAETTTRLRCFALSEFPEAAILRAARQAVPQCSEQVCNNAAQWHRTMRRGLGQIGSQLTCHRSQGPVHLHVPSSSLSSPSWSFCFVISPSAATTT